MSSNLKETALRGFSWTFLEKFGVYISDFTVGILLARLLAPKEFGLIAMIMVFIALLTPFIDSGLGRALIRKIDATDTDYSTVFWWNLMLSICVYLILFFGAPYLSLFYEEPRLTDILRVFGICVIIEALSSIQNTRLVKLMNFKSLAARSLISNFLSGILAIYLAYSGWSYWALIVRQIVSLSLSSIFLWSISGWKPKFEFSKSAFREMFGFGSRLLASGILDAFFNNIYPLIIGKMFSASSLGFYNRANSFCVIPQMLFTQTTARVSYPLLASLQNQKEQMAQTYKKLIKLISYVYFPILMGIMGLAHVIVIVLLTEKWLPAVPLLQGLAFVSMLYPMHSINLNVLTVNGRSDLFLKLEIWKKIIIVISILIGQFWGVMGLIYSQIVSSCIAFIINTYFSERYIQYGLIKQCKDLFPNFVLALAMGLFLLFGSDYLNIFTWWSLIGWTICGIAFYIGISFLFKMDSFAYLLTLAIEKLKLKRLSIHD